MIDRSGTGVCFLAHCGRRPAAARPCRLRNRVIFVVVPVVGPVLMAMGLDPIWLGIMIAVNLQTSFLTPPFGFALFYLRGVAPATVSTSAIYRGVIPFIAIQLLMLVVMALWSSLATWLPGVIYG